MIFLIYLLLLSVNNFSPSFDKLLRIFLSLTILSTLLLIILASEKMRSSGKLLTLYFTWLTEFWALFILLCPSIIHDLISVVLSNTVSKFLSLTTCLADSSYLFFLSNTSTQ
uniref:Uncharacterized protein n=1 Tax=Trametes cingulata TaxID=575983 RepID=D3YNM6_9APHY|nr:hypothetical protein TrcifM_p14 [Trametes cingulata]ADD21058.1 hypothetical protein [Trametes cingulata]